MIQELLRVLVLSDILKLISLLLRELTVGSHESAASDVNVSLKTIDGNSVSTDPRSGKSVRYAWYPVLDIRASFGGKQSESTTRTRPQQLSSKDKGKAIMEEPEKQTKKKDQIMHDEEVSQKLQAQLQAELEEEDRLVRQREEEPNIVAWDNMQAMIDTDYQMAQQMQAKEQEKLSIEEKSKLFIQLLEARKKHFATMRAQ
ncbi:hypothetical protein Tco_0734776 [Tanacetum coccineum]